MSKKIIICVLSFMLLFSSVIVMGADILDSVSGTITEGNSSYSVGGTLKWTQSSASVTATTTTSIISF